MMIPTHTSTKANKVPMLVKSTISSMLMNAAKPPTIAPVRIVVTCGVLNLGWTLAKTGGSKPSLAMEKKIRGCPN